MSFALDRLRQQPRSSKGSLDFTLPSSLTKVQGAFLPCSALAIDSIAVHNGPGFVELAQVMAQMALILIPFKERRRIFLRSGDDIAPCRL